MAVSLKVESSHTKHLKIGYLSTQLGTQLERNGGIKCDRTSNVGPSLITVR